MLISHNARSALLLGVMAYASMFISSSAAKAGDAAPRAVPSPKVTAGPASGETEAERTAWYREAKFGMFIHWGAYSVASVEASWPIMEPEAQWNITEPQYVSLFKRFNPTQYDPKAWVELAKEAGQRYMVFTTKHHDGFCMFDSTLELACQFPQMLTSVVKIDNVKGSGKMQSGQIPNPFRSVAYHHLQERSAPAPFPGFPIKASAELFGAFNGAGIGRRSGSADGVALLIPRRLREHAPQFDFPRMGRLTGDLALPTHRLFLYHRDSRPIHLHIQDGKGLTP